jgi:hypothetical protein
MLPVVILVWGFVGYQLFSSFFTSPNYVQEEFKLEVNVAEIEKEVFLIVANYRDPFLGKKAKYNIKKTSKVSPKNTKTSPVKITKNWPAITYLGMIKNNNSERRVGIVKVNGKEYLVKENEIIEKITVLSMTKSEVVMQFQKEKKTIVK